MSRVTKFTVDGSRSATSANKLVEGKSLVVVSLAASGGGDVEVRDREGAIDQEL